MLLIAASTYILSGHILCPVTSLLQWLVSGDQPVAIHAMHRCLLANNPSPTTASFMVAICMSNNFEQTRPFMLSYDRCGVQSAS